MVEYWAINTQGCILKVLLTLFSSFLKETRGPAFKLESVEEDPSTGLFFFWVRVQNKSLHPIKKDPIELLREARAKNYFSNKDYDWLLDILLENQKRLIEKKHRKPYTLIKHQFSEQLKEPLIVYKNLNNKIFIKLAHDIYSNIESLRKFNSEDCACIGSIIGAYEAEQEFKLKKTAKTNVATFDTLLVSD